MSAVSVQEHGLPSFSSTIGHEPYEYYERLRELGPVVWDDSLNAWLVTSMELSKEVLRNDQVDWMPPEKHAGPPMPGLDRQRWKDFMAYESSKTLHVDDFGEHNRMHRWWMRTFSGRALQVLGDTLVRPVAHAQIDRFAEAGQAELYEDFANRVAPRVIAAAMGLPWEDDDWLAHVLDLHVRRIALIGHKFILQRSGAEPDPELLRSGYAAVDELAELARPFVRERRNGEGTDFISMVWRGADDLFGSEYDEQDVIATVNIAFAGGSGTTAAATAAGLYLMMTRDGLQDGLRDDLEMIPRFVEETLRLYPSIVSTVRMAMHDVELGGVTIREGELMMLLTGALNRDPEHYACPYDVNFERPAPRDHLAFMRGTQTCPGQGLARTQLSTIFSVALERLDDLHLDPSMPPPAYTDPFVRRWRPLHATFTSREHTAAAGR
ncbi:MAG TPA: cytochrome P450 [Ilumatobacter sp.]|nr:cytochrome P450 [Ilumatobacter sp.]